MEGLIMHLRCGLCGHLQSNITSSGKELTVERITEREDAFAIEKVEQLLHEELGGEEPQDERTQEKSQELESLFQELIQTQPNGHWELFVKMLILLAPDEKPTKRNSRRGIHYYYAQELAKIIIESTKLNPERLEFIKRNLCGTPAGDAAEKAFEELRRR